MAADTLAGGSPRGSPQTPEHLTPEMREHYDRLMRLRDELRRQADFLSSEALPSAKEGSGELSSVSTHMADRGSDNSQRMVELNILTSRFDSLEDVDDALRRVMDGSYGQCLDCGRAISPKRLAALPQARYCIDCEGIREKNNGQRPDLD